jgi:arginyl-tRNA synthetase
MPTVLSQLDQKFRAAIQAAFDLDADAQLASSQHEKFGDYQSNAAMGLAKILSEKTGQKSNPRAIAEQIIAKLDLGEMASEVSIAGPGFINVRLAPKWLAAQLSAPLIDKVADPQTIVVDYSGPNIAKEMHVGHLRSTIIGDAICRILGNDVGGLGNRVIRQNHMGDWGTQFGMLIENLVETFGEQKLIEASFVISDLNEFYQIAKTKFDSVPGFADRARERVVALQSGDWNTNEYWRQLNIQSLEHFDDTYDRLGVLLTDTDIRGESFYKAELANIVAELQSAGIAVESEGAIVVQVPGYESPLIIRKSDGGYLYGTTDLAAIRHRVSKLKADRIIYTHDSRQQQHFAQVFWTAVKAGWAKPGTLIYAPFGTMLGEDGKPFKTRTGGTVKLKDLLDEAEKRALVIVTEKNPELPEQQRNRIAYAVGIGGVKYSDLAKDRISDYHFSFDKMLALDGNTAPYLQYAHARICSIFRKDAGQAKGDGPIQLESPFELALAKHILRFGEIIELCARELKPHHLCTYLYELATRFSAFYENCPVLQSEPAVRASRLALCKLAAAALERGLDLLGIEHPDPM